MKRYLFPKKDQWIEILSRPSLEKSTLEKTVNPILDEIRRSGDQALIEYTEKFDGVLINEVKVSENEIAEAEGQITSELKLAIKVASENIHKFHAAQMKESIEVETYAGVTCWQKQTPIERVGIYIPGGTAPLFSTVLMLAIPAKIAGCDEIVLISPPDKSGSIHPAILYAAKISGVTRMYKGGGAQAIAALAYGTESIPATYKIFGPGNQYVTAAKQRVFQDGIAIDMPAGPSEVLVFADTSSDPDFVASDLLSQAEHGTDSQVILISTDQDFCNSVENSINNQLADLPRKDIAEGALQNSKIVILESENECIEFMNRYAPEHLILAVHNYKEVSEKIVNAGSVFLGNYTPESAGDYASGTNHTLPTNGFSRAFSGVTLDSFTKTITFQEISREGIQSLGPTIEVLAENEMLEAHKRAVTIRLQKLKS